MGAFGGAGQGQEMKAAKICKSPIIIIARFIQNDIVI